MYDTFIRKFRITFPELDQHVTEQEIRNAYAVAKEIVRGTDMQRLYATAHLTRNDDLQDLLGETASTSVGGISRSIVVMSKDHGDAFWASTLYGRFYLTLLRQTPKTGIGLYGW